MAKRNTFRTPCRTVLTISSFSLKQFHFHSPSEHTVDGEYFPLEMHLVHEAAGNSCILHSTDGSKLTVSDGQIAVIAAQFQLTENGETTSLLTSVTEKIAAISSPGSVTETGALDFTPLVDVISKQALHTYEGSLTTPPCAEGLKFFVTSQQLPLDVATFNKIKAVVGFNARFTQNSVGADNLLTLSSQTIAANIAAESIKEVEGTNDSGVIRVPVPVVSSTAAVVATPNVRLALQHLDATTDVSLFFRKLLMATSLLPAPLIKHMKLSRA
jgi:carbonic anhydrase